MSSSSSDEDESSRPLGYSWNTEGIHDGAGGVSAYFRQDSHASSCVQSLNADDGSCDDECVSAENERQILLLMLLAQVCALHDPTPRTFTVHVLELYERGILDRESIAFLFDLGLVPDRGYGTTQHALLTTADVEERAIQVRHSLDPNCLRAQEASAIRNRLQRQESSRPDLDRQSTTASSTTYQQATAQLAAELSWNVEQHPLSLSRYFREFDQIKLLSSGSFGSVFHATNKMDGRDYAVKRIIFSESGYSNDAVTQVIREVRCLAQCDHPHVVRYHTSWLEPSWVTGSGKAVFSADHVASKDVQRRLLTDIQRLVNDSASCSSSSQDNDGSKKGNEHSNRFGDTIESFMSEWSTNNSNEDLQLIHWNFPDTPAKEPRHSTYRYQMCFFIQMQLCQPTTLTDWIRDNRNSIQSENDRYEAAIDVFLQLAQGLEHIHDAGIVHRDIKPANCLFGEDGHFKIGDFGLSKLLLRTSESSDSTAATNAEFNLVPPPSCHLQQNNNWQDPMTMGVGTASYCAPEQVNTNTYGPAADIFSLGLILLELVCSFGTEHERIHTFRDCRRGVIPESLNQSYPEAAKTVLWCTSIDPNERPSAKELVNTPFLRRRSKMHRQEMHGLREILAEQEAHIHKQNSELLEKDRIIQELHREMAQLRCNIDRKPIHGD